MRLDGELLVAVAAGSAVAVLAAARWARTGVVLALALIALAVACALSIALPTSASPPAVDDAGAAALDMLVETPYLRTVAIAWSVSSLLVVASGALAVIPLATLASVTAGSLLALAAGVFALGMPDPATGALAALVAGLAALVAAPAMLRDAAASIRELRTVVIAAIAVLFGVALLPALVRPFEPEGGGVLVTGDPLVPAAGAAVLAVSLGTALRFGAIPFHLWVARATDVIPALAVPVIVGWSPMVLGSVAIGVLDADLAPLGAPLGTAQALLAGVGVASVLLGPVAAWIQDDLEHALSYVAISMAGMVVLGLGALEPDAWSATRSWLVVAALSVSGLGAWLALVSARFGTRRLPELEGWARRTPMTAIAFAVTCAVVVGLPGSVVLEARRALPELLLGDALGLLVAAGSAIVVAPLVRILAIGIRRPSAAVARAPGDADGLGAIAAARTAVRGGADASTRARGLTVAARDAVVANRAVLSAGALLLAALLALAVSYGGLDLAASAAGPAPATAEAAGG